MNKRSVNKGPQGRLQRFSGAYPVSTCDGSFDSIPAYQSVLVPTLPNLKFHREIAMNQERNLNYANAAQPTQGIEAASRAVRDKLSSMAGECVAGRQTTKTLLLEHAERLRRHANNLEGLAYAIEHVGGDAEATLYGLLSGEIFKR